MKLLSNLNWIRKTAIIAAGLLVLIVATPTPVFAGRTCGSGDDAYEASIDLGCSGHGNPITDLVFAIVRFLTTGVGLVVVGSLIYAGIQYTGSRGDPQATAAAQNRIRNNVIALLMFMFAYAILNYIIPGQVLK